jgi:type II secretory pathway component PulF
MGSGPCPIARGTGRLSGREWRVRGVNISRFASTLAILVEGGVVPLIVFAILLPIIEINQLVS